MRFIRLLGWLFGISALFYLVGAAAAAVYIASVSDDLPGLDELRDYAPAVLTRIHSADGQLIYEPTGENSERRLFLPIEMMPEQLRNAYISAEDKNFYSHFGFDPLAFARAMFTNVTTNLLDGSRWIGASTITQQVAKNFLTGDEYSVERKINEVLLSFSIESAFTKDEILEIYMNHNNLGLYSSQGGPVYGVASAALVYFDKAVSELTLAEMAYFAALPKAPNNYNPAQSQDAAYERTHWVLDEMYQNEFITDEELEEAKADQFLDRFVGRRISAGEYGAGHFIQAVRDQLESYEWGAGAYEAGLSVRTTLDPNLQVVARTALMDGLVRYDQTYGDGWQGAVATLDAGALADGPDGTPGWAAELLSMRGRCAFNPHAPGMLCDVPEWRLAVVLDTFSDRVEIGLAPDASAPETVQTGVVMDDDMPYSGAEAAMQVGDVIFVQYIGTRDGERGYALRRQPGVNGALVAMDPQTGRVLAMVGGFSYSSEEWNYATQAERPPGSTFKPFVFSAALDSGFTPSHTIRDSAVRICPDGPGSYMVEYIDEIPPSAVTQGNPLGTQCSYNQRSLWWEPQNYCSSNCPVFSNAEMTLRSGLERSLNVVTGVLATQLGFDTVAQYARNFGIYDNPQPFPSISLGAQDTTVLRLVSAYAVLANGGRFIEPTLIDRIQDRYGATLPEALHDARQCSDCNAAVWDGQPLPTVVENQRQVLDPMTAHQVTRMLEGVVLYGTARSAFSGISDDYAIAGKTGTSDDVKDSWFVGYTTDLVIGVFVGYKDPRPMGSAATGGGLAAPIAADVFETALAGGAYTAFAPPPGMEVFPVDRTTGLADYSGGPNVVFEAFKPGTAPPNEGSTFNPGFQNGATQAPVTLGGAPLSSGPSIQEIQSSISTGSGVF